MSELDEVKDAKEVSGRPSGAVVKGGHEIGVGIPAEGKRHWFKMPHQMLAPFIEMLRSFGEGAARARAGQPSSLDDIAYPNIVKGRAVAGRGHDGQTIAIRFPTEVGIPVIVAMTRQQATELQGALAAELAKPTPSGPAKN